MKKNDGFYVIDICVGALIIALVCYGIYTLKTLSASKNPNTHQNESLVEFHAPKSLDDLNAFIESLPDGAFKANLYIILATEYAGDSVELHAMLNAYAKMQMQKLQREKNGGTI